MNKSTWIDKVSAWMPTVFCIGLGWQKLLSPGDTGNFTFYTFLPACFVMVWVTHWHMGKRVEALEAALRENSTPAGLTGDA